MAHGVMAAHLRACPENNVHLHAQMSYRAEKHPTAPHVAQQSSFVALHSLVSWFATRNENRRRGKIDNVAFYALAAPRPAYIENVGINGNGWRNVAARRLRRHEEMSMCVGCGEMS